MEETELLKELKYDKMVLTCLKPMKVISASSAIIFDTKFVKDVYELNYVSHINYLDQASSHIYIYLLCISLFGYVVSALLEEYLNEDVNEITNKIKNKTLYK